MSKYKPYELSDKAIKILQKKIVRRFSKAKGKILTYEFDEINARRIVKDLYKDLESDNEKMFLELAKSVYTKESDEDKVPDRKWLKENILESYDPVTFYMYMAETERKQERMIESVIAAGNKVEAINKAMRYWNDMTVQYCDTVEDKAIRKAYKDSGIEKVEWVTEHDDRVCSECDDRDGKVYSIHHVPSKPHWGCRCHVVPVE